ncbi:unnamed protein product [Arabidopsis thaliana]|uniref:Uncharacterized protein n=4 Tax=Arabidopsis TaxID=3701 RepID=A0A654E868_ARATH|nr:uncharacterized protein AT1G05136 [Arabidopsis thaliana]KAG7595892.1 hypothetical protein ISN44_As06g004260 [Arabidopsis suecica]KAG7645136.1 hypothetical protein ISN45_At01g004380 [Arabidopsis thaliana x Arabidopsis arenosa]AEE27793.1 hypothetical protein AT1G05136 [Arabidopsis thaliana]CAA0166871.1 unnamed protein product [Arabidopsis thaliana]VYS45055.1 unnamed protein product [Arabidopsis thaliana]|eukprot:NP_001117229.1 hypothetical protein AT1G05136 [Arabidopsis thaliana]
MKPPKSKEISKWDEEAINMDPHACYVLRVWGRWAIGGNHLMNVFFD